MAAPRRGGARGAGGRVRRVGRGDRAGGRQRAAGVLGVLAAAFAGWAGWTWWRADADESLSYAQARDEVVAAGRAHVALLTTLDASDVDGGIDRWLTVSTGPLRDAPGATGAAEPETLGQGG